ncbi:MAG: PAS domain-containing protein [Burkholderiales bacterium]|nr:PAS domain-containing protein [Burkholderiales bacterium]
MQSDSSLPRPGRAAAPAERPASAQTPKSPRTPKTPRTPRAPRTGWPALPALPARLQPALALGAWLLALLLGALAWQAVWQLRAEEAAAQNAQRSLLALAQLRATVAEAEAALHQAEPSADPEALPAYVGARQAADAGLAELRLTGPAGGEAFDRIVALGALLAQRFDALAATLQARAARGTAAVRTAGAGDDARLQAELRGALDGLAGQARERLQAERARAQAAGTLALAAVATASLLALGLLGWGGWRARADRRQAGRARAAEQAAVRDRLQAEAALQQVFDASLDALCLIDAEGRYARVGAACERLWGRPAAALRGQPYAELVHPEDRRRLEQALAAAGPAGAELACRCRRPDGTVLPVVWKALPLGGAGGLLCLVRDASEMQALRAEAALKDRELQGTAAELAQAQARAATTARLRREFMTHVGAGLRSSPVAIVSLGESLQQGLAGPLNPEQSRELARLLDTARSLGARLNALLDLALIDGGELVLAREPFDLQETVQRVADEARAAADRRGLRFEARLATDLGYARGDALRVEQVLRSLVEQTLKGPGSGTLRLAAASPADGRVVVTVVSARGDEPALDAEAGAALFDPFRAGGAGLVLAQAQRLCALMGGELAAAAGPGRGFELVLRADDAGQA